MPGNGHLTIDMAWADQLLRSYVQGQITRQATRAALINECHIPEHLAEQALLESDVRALILVPPAGHA